MEEREEMKMEKCLLCGFEAEKIAPEHIFYCDKMQDNDPVSAMKRERDAALARAEKAEAELAAFNKDGLTIAYMSGHASGKERMRAEMATLSRHIQVLREALEGALECLENNGFGKKYIEAELRSALSATAPQVLPLVPADGDQDNRNE